MNRNVNDYFTHTPTPHFPRNRFDMGVHKKLFSMQHGRLYPFYCRMVYPGDLWTDNPTPFIRMDTSLRVPLDEVFLDTYFFFVPFRILDENFAKVLGDKDVYDDNEYSIPQFTLTGPSVSGTPGHLYGINNIITYLGYSQASAIASSGQFGFGFADTFNAYPLAAYYKVWNDWFRDENVDPEIPFQDLFNGTDASNSLDPIFDNFEAKKVNKYHDYFTSSTISPQKGPAVTIPLGTSAPVGIISQSSSSLSAGVDREVSLVDPLDPGDFGQLRLSANNGSSTYGKMFADLSRAGGSINELRLAFAIQSLYERRNRFGTRYIETIRGQWGIEVPDSFFMRPEYLGGSRVSLNQVPVLSTENSSSLGAMAGNSATLGGNNAYSKQFIEYGVILGLCCTRVHHSYGQGKRKELWSLKIGLDLYNPVFANIGFQPVMRNEIYNQGDSDTTVFAYQEAWAELRAEFDEFKGLFGIFSANNDLRNYWHYGDYYSSAPSFSASWLKEDGKNVVRTLTGRLITDASTISSDVLAGHQYMVAYYIHPKVTRILPAHSVPVELIGRL